MSIQSSCVGAYVPRVPDERREREKKWVTERETDDCIIHPTNMHERIAGENFLFVQNNRSAAANESNEMYADDVPAIMNEKLAERAEMSLEMNWTNN